MRQCQNCRSLQLQFEANPSLIPLFHNISNKNKGEKFEEDLLLKYGDCKSLQNYGLKILFITDIHNCLAYTEKYLNYLKSIKQEDYDICILLGDLSGADIDEIKKIIPNEKIFGVVGNHDSKDFLEKNEINNIF